MTTMIISLIAILIAAIILFICFCIVCLYKFMFVWLPFRNQTMESSQLNDIEQNALPSAPPALDNKSIFINLVLKILPVPVLKYFY